MTCNVLGSSIHPKESLDYPLASSPPVAAYVSFAKPSLPYSGSPNHVRPEVDMQYVDPNYRWTPPPVADGHL